MKILNEYIRRVRKLEGRTFSFLIRTITYYINYIVFNVSNNIFFFLIFLAINSNSEKNLRVGWRKCCCSNPNGSSFNNNNTIKK